MPDRCQASAVGPGPPGRRAGRWEYEGGCLHGRDCACAASADAPFAARCARVLCRTTRTSPSTPPPVPRNLPRSRSVRPSVRLSAVVSARMEAGSWECGGAHLAPALPAPLQVPEIQAQLNDQTLPLFDRYKAMFSLRNNGSKAAVSHRAAHAANRIGGGTALRRLAGSWRSIVSTAQRHVPTLCPPTAGQCAHHGVQRPVPAVSPRCGLRARTAAGACLRRWGCGRAGSVAGLRGWFALCLSRAPSSAHWRWPRCCPPHRVRSH